MIPLTGKPIESRIGHIDRVNRPSAYNVSTGALNPATEKSAPPDPTDTGTIPTETRADSSSVTNTLRMS
jgi:hypothetical protein